MRILLAGVGNLLRADDGFGVAVARRLAELDLPEGVTVVETGIGGIALVQEIQDGYDALLVADTVDFGRQPGTIMIIEPEVIDVEALSWGERYDLLADMHLANPQRVFMMARALGVLPAFVRIVGCQPVDAHGVGTEMSPPVAAAVEVGVSEMLRQVELLLSGEGPKPPPPNPLPAQTSRP
ncbi:MAG: hydrogenase maturation protease [Acidimicrobiales bacterium]